MIHLYVVVDCNSNIHNVYVYLLSDKDYNYSDQDNNSSV